MKPFFQMFRDAVLTACVVVALGTTAFGQVVINEIVNDQRNATGGTDPLPTHSQFVELYNAGNSAVDIGNWTLDFYDLVGGGLEFSDIIPTGATIPAGGYYVIGAATVPNVNFIVDGTWPSGNWMYQLNDNTSNIMDAVAINSRLNPQVSDITPEQQAEVGIGWWGQLISNETGFTQSLSRYIDGRDTNSNGRDFGMLPLTPGASNNLPQVGAFQIPDVDGAVVGSDVLGFGASFVRPRVIDPTVADGNNPRSIPPSPQGGNAIVAWDPAGGGNMVASNALVNSFELYAYFDTAPLNVGTTATPASELTTYGIGTTDPFFASANPSGQMSTPVIRSNNGNTGLGWYYQREDQLGPAVLSLVDFGEGGNSIPSAEMWNVIVDIDMSTMDSDWYRLGIDYDPATGDVVARFDDQIFNFTTETDQVGTFYVGYRENLPGVPSEITPAIFDLFVAPDENADFNGDGIVDGHDFLAWQRGFGILGGASPANGDANADGNVDGQDLAIWESQFGSAPLTAAVAIPEPSTALLLLLGCAAASCRRR